MDQVAQSKQTNVSGAGRAAMGRRNYALGLVAALLVIAMFAALRAMAPIAIPVVIAVFVALAVLPMDRAVAERLPKPLSWLGRAFVMVFLLSILAMFIVGLSYCVTQIATQLPDVSERLSNVLLERASSGQGNTDVWTAALTQLRNMLDDQGAALADMAFNWASGVAQGVASSTGALLAGLFLVLFLVLLALSEADNWAAKLDNILTDRDRPWRQMTTRLGQAWRRFLATRAVMGLITAVAYTLWFLPFDLDLLLVWGILTFLMNFIPNLGSIVSGVLPSIYAFLTLDPGTALLLAAGLVLIEQVIGNWLDPRVQGNSVAVSPLVILVAVLFWGWFWGIAGAFLATPITLAIMIFCNYVRALRPLALLLSNQRRAADLDDALSG